MVTIQCAVVLRYRAVCKQFGANTGRIALCLLVFSAGMFISSTAFLPSTFAMYTTLIAMAAWFYGDFPVAIFAIAAGTIVGWPFAAVLGLVLLVKL